MNRMFTCVLALLVNCSAFAQSELMLFEAFPPSPLLQKFMGVHGWTIYGSGPVDPDAARRLEHLLVKNKIPLGSSIYFNSPGGNLVGGMKLGRVVRKHQLASHIGRRDLSSQHKFSTTGMCVSACAMAYLGGEYRFLSKGSVYGVHRFFWNERKANEADVAQVVSAAVVEYIRSMDVHTDLFSVASGAGRDEMITPSMERLVELNVVNNGAKKPKWSIESVDEGMYLKGEQETANGINKFMLVCSSTGPMYLYFIFDPGNNAEEVMTFGTESLQAGATKIDLHGRKAGKKLVNGWINATYVADDEILASLKSANRIGILMQPTREAAFFAGFDSMPFQEGAKKLNGFLSVCQRGDKKR